MKDADPVLDMIDILQNVTNPPPPAFINLPSSSTSDKPKEHSQVVAKDAPTSYVTVQQPQQQHKSMPNTQNNTEPEDNEQHPAILSLSHCEANVKMGLILLLNSFSFSFNSAHTYGTRTLVKQRIVQHTKTQQMTVENKFYSIFLQWHCQLGGGDLG